VTFVMKLLCNIKNEYSSSHVNLPQHSHFMINGSIQHEFVTFNDCHIYSSTEAIVAKYKYYMYNDNFHRRL